MIKMDELIIANDYIPLRMCDDVIMQNILEDQFVDPEFSRTLDMRDFVLDEKYIPIHICDDVVPRDIPHDQLINTVFRRKSIETGIPITELIQFQGQYR